MAHFMQGSNYTHVVQALKTSAGLAAIFQAVNNSAWCKGCQKGQYPTDLAAAVGGKPGSIATGVGTGSGSGTSAGGATSGGSNDLSTCVISFPGFLFFSGPCILTKGGVKWLSGALALVVGAGVGVFAVTILASAAFKGSGAQGAATKIAGLIPGPEAKIATTLASKAGSSGGSSSRTRAPRIPQAPSAPQIPTAGRRESRGIERQYRSATEQQGPIGPRGGNPTSTRIAQRERRGTSVPGPRRREPPNVRGGGPF
jgi:hypothetical protein